MDDITACAPPLALSRRHFLKLTALIGGGLLISCSRSSPVEVDEPGANPDPPSGPASQLSPFLRIAPDNRVTVIMGASEIGQGIHTGLAMVIAEELDADWSQVGSEHSPVVPLTYNNTYFVAPIQSTIGSASMRGYYQRYREVGALVRRLLVETAAARWQVDAARLVTDNGHVVDPVTGRRSSYGELAADAATRPMPASAPLKDPAAYRLVGTPRRRVEVDAKVNGSLKYGIDFEIPGMFTVVVARPPRFFGQALIYDDSAALAVPGVREVHRTPIGIAVVADNLWSAERGRKALTITWDSLLGGRTDSQQQRGAYEALLNLPGVPVRNDGEVTTAQALAAETLQADYYFPFQAHAAMEPLNVIVDYNGLSARIWTGTQSPTIDWYFASVMLALPPTQVEFHTLPSGGGFGRRGNWLADFVRDACQVAFIVRKPMKLVWTREDDMKGGYYRPMATVRLSASLNDAGELTAWTHRAVTQDITALLYGEQALDQVSALLGGRRPEPPQELMDLDKNFAYGVPNVRMDMRLDAKPEMPSLWMRGVNKVTDLFAQETFFDQVARHVGKEPYAWRRELLEARPRHRAVLDAAASAIGWGTTPAAETGAQRARGIAVLSHWNSYIAQAVELSVTEDKEIRVHRIVNAVECGRVVNPDLVKAQMESAVLFALSSLFYGEITLVDGVVQQGNFNDYRLMRMFESPPIETVILPSTEVPGGVGELGVPCVAPAVVNAIFAATGAEIRELPLRNLGYRVAERNAVAGAAA